MEPFDSEGIRILDNLYSQIYPDFIVVYLDRKGAHHLKNQLQLHSIKFCEDRKFQKEVYPQVIEERNNYSDEGAYLRAEKNQD